MFLTTYQPRTPSLRHSSTLSVWYLHFKKHRRLALGFQSSAGRGISGKQTVLSKGSRRTRRVFRVIHTQFGGLFSTTMICEYQKDPLRTCVLALVYNSLGGWFYLPQTSNMVQFGYIRLRAFTYSNIFYNWHWPSQLRNFSLHSRICYIEQAGARSPCGGSGAVKFIRAAGASGLILSTGFYRDWSLILMPSGAIKIFWNRSNAHPGWICHEVATGRNKAGLNINRGLRPIVRGTVKNANDHPNGGRVRSLKCSRTPWGYPAKKSRHPAVKIMSKSLVKRQKTAERLQARRGAGSVV